MLSLADPILCDRKPYELIKSPIPTFGNIQLSKTMCKLYLYISPWRSCRSWTRYIITKSGPVFFPGRKVNTIEKMGDYLSNKYFVFVGWKESVSIPYSQTIFYSLDSALPYIGKRSRFPVSVLTKLFWQLDSISNIPSIIEYFVFLEDSQDMLNLVIKMCPEGDIARFCWYPLMGNRQYKFIKIGSKIAKNVTLTNMATRLALLLRVHYVFNLQCF